MESPAACCLIFLTNFLLLKIAEVHGRWLLGGKPFLTLSGSLPQTKKSYPLPVTELQDLRMLAEEPIVFEASNIDDLWLLANLTWTSIFGSRII